MKSKEKISITLDDYTSLLLEKAVQRYDLDQIVGRPKPWLVKQALEAVAFAILQRKEDKLSLPLTVALTTQTEQQEAARERLSREAQGELFPDDSFESPQAGQTPKPTKWYGFDGFKRISEIIE